LIVVDTSVWIAARKQPRVAEVLRGLLEADEVALALPVRLELWVAVPKHQRKTFLQTYGALPQFHPTEDTWRTLHGWIEKAGDAGQTFTIQDLLIASSAAELGGLVWSLDKDFERMERLGFVSRYDPPDVH
jgi:predicted nucleic acid-binding protein